MANINEIPAKTPVVPDDGERSTEEKVMLAQNLVQFYFSNLDYRNRHPEEENISEAKRNEIFAVYGEEFKQWYSSAEGAEALAHYVKEHSTEAIIDQKDMGDLVRSFLAFRNRS